MEFDLIERIRRRVATRDDVVLGIGDDAALLQVPADRQLVIAMDTLNEGVHFPADTAAADIGWKALAVNLSDLAAMGAEPAWCTLSLSLPQPDAGWIDGFLDGFAELADRHAVALVGGDTTRGPLSVCVTVHGFARAGRALRRDGARSGDDIWVSGTLGDAALALGRLLAPAGQDAAGGAGSPGFPADDGPRRAAWATLRARLDRPVPRVELGHALAGIASACIDVSDGLLADLAHLCRASRCGARIDIDALPASVALAEICGAEARRALQAAGGDDYELCFTAPSRLRRNVLEAAQAAGIAVTRIGAVQPAAGVLCVDRDGRPWHPSRRGYEHFSGSPGGTR